MKHLTRNDLTKRTMMLTNTTAYLYYIEAKGTKVPRLYFNDSFTEIEKRTEFCLLVDEDESTSLDEVPCIYLDFNEQPENADRLSWELKGKYKNISAIPEIIDYLDLHEFVHPNNEDCNELEVECHTEGIYKIHLKKYICDKEKSNKKCEID